MDERKLYMDKINTHLEQSKNMIERMRNAAARADENMKQDYQREVEALEHKLSGLKDKYGQLEHSNESTWESIKDGAESAWESLTEAVEKATKRFHVDETDWDRERGRFDGNDQRTR